MADPVFRTVSFRLDEADRADIVALQRHTNIRNLSDLLRMAVRESCHTRGIQPLDVKAKTGTEG